MVCKELKALFVGTKEVSRCSVQLGVVYHPKLYASIAETNMRVSAPVYREDWGYAPL